MNYRFRATEQFWSSFYGLSPAQKESARRAWAIFKINPFDPRLRAHKIQRLSAHYKQTIYSVEVESDLRLVFYLDGDTVISLIIGTHDLYKG
jgi:mRNA-degrading endonuclease YafQ of YafQ-DinJ toxin-antitoxin module